MKIIYGENGEDSHKYKAFHCKIKESFIGYNTGFTIECSMLKC